MNKIKYLFIILYLLAYNNLFSMLFGGKTPLMEAASIGDLQEVRNKIGQRANVNDVDNQNMTALDYAVLFGADVTLQAPEVAKQLYGTKTPQYLDVIKFLVQRGANLEGSGKRFDTPLIALAKSYLLAVNNFKDNENYETFDKTRFRNAFTNFESAYNYLVSQGADESKEDNFRKTARTIFNEALSLKNSLGSNKRKAGEEYKPGAQAKKQKVEEKSVTYYAQPVIWPPVETSKVKN